MTHTSVTLDAVLLDELRRRRAELRESMGALETALASPGSDHVHWTGRVHVALVELSADLRLHVEVTEEPGGLYTELREAAPRLTGAVDALCAEHARLRQGLDDLLMLLDGPNPVIVTEAVRQGGTRLLSEFSRHRQRGADLVYEAFEVDVGGET